MLPTLVFCVFIAVMLIAGLRSPSVLLAALFSIFAIKGWMMVSSPYFMANRTLINFVYGGLIALIMLISFQRCFKSISGATWVSMLVITLYLYAFLSLLWVPDAAHADKIWLTEYPYILVNIFAIPLLLMCDCKWTHFAKMQIVVGAVFSLLLLLTAKWGIRGLAIGNEVGNETNPLEIAQLGAITGICAVFCPFKKNPAVILLRLALLALSVIIILKSGTRGQLIGMALSILVVWLTVNGIFDWKKTIGLLMGSALFSWAISWGIDAFWTTKFADRYSAANMSSDYEGRLDMASRLVDAWMHSPISIVMGLGNSASFDPSIIGIYPHFVPLEILGEEGLVGFVIYIAILGLMITGILRSIKGIRRKSYPALLASEFSIGLCAWLYTFTLTLKQGSLIGNSIFFSISIILYSSIRKLLQHKVVRPELMIIDPMKAEEGPIIVP